MIDLRAIHSLSDFQRNARQYVEQLQEKHQLIVLTINGKAAVVLQDAESYQLLLDELESLRAAAAVKQAIKEFEQGQGKPARLALEELRAKHDIPR